MIKIIDLQSKDGVFVMDLGNFLTMGNTALWKRKQIVVLFTGGSKYLYDMAEAFTNVGCLVVDTWGVDVDIVVRDDTSYSKRVIRNADKNGVPVITKAAVFKAVMDDDFSSLLSRTMARNTSKKHKTFGLSLSDYK